MGIVLAVFEGREEGGERVGGEDCGGKEERVHGVRELDPLTSILLQRIPLVPDVQSLLPRCAEPRATYLLRVVSSNTFQTIRSARSCRSCPHGIELGFQRYNQVTSRVGGGGCGEGRRGEGLGRSRC